ncbi:hypothetical protein V2S66_31360 [Streptomyces sp. V4-01]|uniref:Uncharacterized protein n=1 Tax=Actinacidiphila polyblastidii TaxID=3110430 RepID=A0ABU7PKU2_9ACTN|nr:hypothetical protein [Streptomyces sp. V4-01]
MDNGGVTAVVVSALALVGTGYTARSARAAGRENARRDEFQLLYERQDRAQERQDREMSEVRGEVQTLKRSQRLLVSYVRDLREALRRSGSEPPPPPAGLDLSPWDDLD